MIDLGAELRVADAPRHYEMLLGVPPGSSLVLEAGSVARVDGAGLQAVAAAIVFWRTAGTTWRWNNASGPLRAASRLAGLDAHLELK